MKIYFSKGRGCSEEIWVIMKVDDCSLTVSLFFFWCHSFIPCLDICYKCKFECIVFHVFQLCLHVVARYICTTTYITYVFMCKVHFLFIDWLQSTVCGQSRGTHYSSGHSSSEWVRSKPSYHGMETTVLILTSALCASALSYFWCT